MSLAAIQGKLSRAEMRSVLAGGSGSCGVVVTRHDSGSRLSVSGISKADAQRRQGQAMEQGIGGDADNVYWCCASYSNYAPC
jgi:hypothetical protein